MAALDCIGSMLKNIPKSLLRYGIIQSLKRWQSVAAGRDKNSHGVNNAATVVDIRVALTMLPELDSDCLMGKCTV